MPQTAVKERPILFNAQMIRALLDGSKTMTRRVVKPQPTRDAVGWCAMKETASYIAGYGWGENEPVNDKFVAECCPYGEVGDHLWTKEAVWQWGRWASNGKTKTGKPARRFIPIGRHAQYVADCADCPKDIPQGRKAIHADEQWIKRPPIFAPRWSSRITLEITDIRVERVQEISVNDIQREGVRPELVAGVDVDIDGFFWPDGEKKHRDQFEKLWQLIHGDDPVKSWVANPFVWVITFRVLEPQVLAEVK